jgi:hypothetical protein
LFTADGPILKLLFYEEKNVLITVTESLILTQHAILPEGDAKEILKVKLHAVICVTHTPSHCLEFHQSIQFIISVRAFLPNYKSGSHNIQMLGIKMKISKKIV